MVTDSDKLSRQYMMQQLALALLLFVAAYVVDLNWPREALLSSAVVGGSFVAVLALVIGIVWCRLAKHSPDSLPTFFMAVSSFRLLLALLVMLIYYLTTTGAAMMTFFLVFMAFYLVALVHHTVFFARVSNRS